MYRENTPFEAEDGLLAVHLELDVLAILDPELIVVQPMCLFSEASKDLTQRFQSRVFLQLLAAGHVLSSFPHFGSEDSTEKRCSVGLPGQRARKLRIRNV